MSQCANHHSSLGRFTSSAPFQTVPEGWSSRTADVRDEASLAAAVEAATSRFGGLGIVVANAAIAPPRRCAVAVAAASWSWRR
jgi:NAD(P)-dependent dehydrogenase (short-subunit alcohol dehydrogenase family)